MLFRVMADAVVVVHLAFILFVATGSLLALRWPRLVWLHVPALVWGVGIIAVGWTCPLTPLEKFLRREAGDEGYEGGFVDRYVEGVVYPEELTPLLRAIAAVGVVAGYVAMAGANRLRRTDADTAVGGVGDRSGARRRRARPGDRRRVG